VVSPGRHWFPAEPAGPFLRLSYAGAGHAALASAVEVLARVLGGSASPLSGPPDLVLDRRGSLRNG
jgi:DNA-binding transcriptional MocR family regulator